MDLVGLHPAGTGISRQVTSTSLAAVALPSAAGGVEAPTDAGTGTFPTRYAALVSITALSANVWMMFGDSTVITATTTTSGYSVVVPTSVTVLYRRPAGTTHFRAISDGTATLHIVPQEWEMQSIN